MAGMMVSQSCSQSVCTAAERSRRLWNIQPQTPPADVVDLAQAREQAVERERPGRDLSSSLCVVCGILNIIERVHQDFLFRYEAV